eukprot:5184536-Amphidinium_carterae.1
MAYRRALAEKCKPLTLGQPESIARRRWLAPTWLADLVELAREKVEGFSNLWQEHNCQKVQCHDRSWFYLLSSRKEFTLPIP